MNSGHADMCRITGTRKDNPFVSVAALRQLIVTTPSIGHNLGAFFDNVTNERHKAGAGYVRYAAHSHPAEALGRMNFHRDNHDLLTCTTAPSFSTHFTAAHVSLIHFNAAVDSIPSRTDHGSPQFMQPRPSRLITAQAKNAFQTQCTRPVFLTDHEPHCGKPGSQGRPRPVKDGARRHRNLAAALPAMKVPPSCRPWFGFPTAMSTYKALRPTATHKITSACRFVGKPFQKLLVGTRVVFARHRMRIIAHTHTYYMLWSLASSGYPPNLKGFPNTPILASNGYFRF